MPAFTVDEMTHLKATVPQPKPDAFVQAMNVLRRYAETDEEARLALGAPEW